MRRGWGYVAALLFAAAVLLRLVFPRLPGEAAEEGWQAFRESVTALGQLLAGEESGALAAWWSGP